MGYTVDSLVIETRTIRCGKCYKINMAGSFSWEKFSDEDTVATCDRYTGNCQIAPRRGCEDPIIGLVKDVWDHTYSFPPKCFYY